MPCREARSTYNKRQSKQHDIGNNKTLFEEVSKLESLWSKGKEILFKFRTVDWIQQSFLGGHKYINSWFSQKYIVQSKCMRCCTVTERKIACEHNILEKLIDGRMETLYQGNFSPPFFPNTGIVTATVTISLFWSRWFYPSKSWHGMVLNTWFRMALWKYFLLLEVSHATLWSKVFS